MLACDTNFNQKRSNRNITFIIAKETYYMQKILQGLKGTSNCLAEFEKNIETASQIFLNFLHDLRGILPEIDTNLPCSSPPPWSVTNMVELNYRFLWKAPNYF